MSWSGVLSHLYPLLSPLLSINCLEAAQPRAIVASLLSGLVDTSWELPCHLGCFGHCLGAFDPFLLLEAFSLNWETPHSLEFPPFCATPFLTLWLTFFYFIFISWDFSQFCLRPLFFLDSPIYGLGFQCPWHHWFSNRRRAVKNVGRCTSYHQHSLSYWPFLGMVVPQLYMCVYVMCVSVEKFLFDADRSQSITCTRRCYYTYLLGCPLSTSHSV